MDWFLKNHVCELNLAENNLVQLLLSQFSLHLVGKTARLEIEFDGNTPTIRRRESKKVVKDAMPNFASKSIEYQQSLDALLLERTEDKVMFNDPEFVFRYGSGGTLPIIQIGNRLYYCLFYRDVHPIGWNIANGGTDSFEELINPFRAIFRELGEELIILDFDRQIDYLFLADDGTPLTRPEFETPRVKWQSRFGDKNLRRFKKQNISMEWQNGPDSLVIKFGSEMSKNLHGCFLNINALDFGIEVDRIAKIRIDENSILLDGELIGNKLLDRPIGLFRVDKFTRDLLRNDDTEFFPDILFHSGSLQPEREIERIINNFVTQLTIYNVRKEFQKEEWEKTTPKFPLCPVTSRIIRRNLPTMNDGKTITHELMQQIVEFLTSLPGIDDRDAQRALIYSAGFDESLRRQIQVSGASLQFFQLLVQTAVSYGKLEDGRLAIEAVLDAAKERVGADRREKCNMLIRKIQNEKRQI